MFKPFSILLVHIIGAFSYLNAQELPAITLEQCQEWTQQNYPLSKQLDLVQRSKAYNLKNASQGFLPQVSISGQASYQSDVTEVPIELPNSEIPTISKDQYKVYADVYLPLSNRSLIKNQKAQIECAALVEAQEIEVELFKLKERVNQLYLGVLLINDQIQQFQNFEKDITNAIEKTLPAIENGLAIESDLQLLEAERINNEQKIAEQLANKKAYINMLGKLTNQTITTNTKFIIPKLVENEMILNRPELKLFSLQSQSLETKLEQINKRIIPNVGLFLQVGYGRPGLNFLSNGFEAYGIGGLQFSWNLSQLYSSKNDRENLSISQLKIANQKASFLLNTEMTLDQQSEEIQKYQTLLQADQKLIDIRKTIKETAEVQLENGLISALDYLNYINAESKAKQNLAMHKTQLLLAQINLKNTSGN